MLPASILHPQNMAELNKNSQEAEAIEFSCKLYIWRESDPENTGGSLQGYVISAIAPFTQAHFIMKELKFILV